jgi:hypothetical protein
MFARRSKIGNNLLSGWASRREAHREIRHTDVYGCGAIVVAGFGRRTAICLRGARRSLYRERSGLCRAGARERRAALCGTGCRLRRTGLWGTGLWGTGTRVRTTGLCRTGARIRCTGLCGTGARLQGSRLLWSRSARRTASLCRARASLPIRLCGRIRAEAARRHPLQRRWSLHRQSRLRSAGILPLRPRCPRAKGRFKHEPSAHSVAFRRFAPA